MSVLSDNYKKILSEIEEKIKNQEDLEFVKQKISEISMMFMDVIDNLSNATDEKLKKIEEKQEKIEQKMLEVENYVNDIETDMLEELDEMIETDEEYEFEITCPYCDNEFITDINGKDEITCPNCSNVIELDWNEEEESKNCCSNHGCSSCPGCNSNNIQEKDSNDDDM